MQAYLAEKYMSGPKADAILSRAAPKKKKKKAKASEPSSSSAGLVKDLDGGWGDEGRDDDDDELENAVVEKDRTFKKRRTEQTGAAGTSGWTTVRPGLNDKMDVDKEGSPPPVEDERPQVVDAKPVGGLLTSEQLKRVLPSAQKLKQTEEERDAAQETVYRDASGRKIDTKIERAEAARKKREREELEAKKMEWGKGVVQRGEEEKRKRQLEKEKKMDLAIYADDKELNEEQKAKERWNDPAAAFIEKRTKKGPRRPEYTGPTPPPNRFGIKPGYRWDGVDRSNGFEKKLFQKQNEKKRTTLASYEWSVDDM